MKSTSLVRASVLAALTLAGGAAYAADLTLYTSPNFRGNDLTLLMSQSDMNHSRALIDVEFTIERGANLLPA